MTTIENRLEQAGQTQAPTPIYWVEKPEASYLMLGNGQRVAPSEVPAWRLEKCKRYSPNKDGITVSPDDWD